MPKLPFGDKGVARVIFDYGGPNEIRVNPTFGKTELRVSDKVSDVAEEELGADTPVDAVFTGTVTEMDVPMTRSTIAQIVTIFPGVVALPGGGATFRVKAGCAMYENSVQVLLQPLCDNAPDVDPDHAILIYHAHPFRDFSLGFDSSSQRIHMVKFKVFPSQESARYGRTHQYGV